MYVWPMNLRGTKERQAAKRGKGMVSLVLQHTHKSMKVLLGIMSTVLLMALGYGWATYDTKLNQLLAVIVCCGIGVFLNSVSCKDK